MSTKSSLQKNNRTLIKTLLMSFAIGFFVITMMIFPIQNPKPEWGENWKIKPLIIVPLMSVIGSIPFYFTLIRKFKSSSNKFYSTIAAILLFLICLWLGIILGLNGTLWI